SDKEAEKLSQELPSCASKDYGRPFAEVFKAVNMDFYQIDPLLFSPAKVSIKNMATGKTFTGGELNESLINKSFFS
ncbi:MAG TPA: methenyltetrahydromethanopterin cyclohydrolase, partial [Methylotenera sp.]|nr:methenyltetrahydromethanopterin cyclohydrolase [Methylotenera sp.]